MLPGTLTFQHFWPMHLANWGKSLRFAVGQMLVLGPCWHIPEWWVPTADRWAPTASSTDYVLAFEARTLSRIRDRNVKCKNVNHSSTRYKFQNLNKVLLEYYGERKWLHKKAGEVFICDDDIWVRVPLSKIYLKGKKNRIYLKSWM